MDDRVSDAPTNIQHSLCPNLGWWAISGEDLLAAFRRVAAGESADAIYLELYANAAHTQVK